MSSSHVLCECRRCSSGLRAYPDRTGHACPSEPTVAAWVFGQVLLMVILRIVELRSRQDLCRHGAVAGPSQLTLEGDLRPLRSLFLSVGVVVDARAVLRADVIALAHALRGVVVLPKGAKQLFVRHSPRVVHHEDHFVVTRHPGTDFA